MDNRTAVAALIRTRSASDGGRTYGFLASDDSVDRSGEVIARDAWDLTAYRANPIILDGHDYSSVTNIIGRAVKIEQTPRGLEVDIRFNGSPKGQIARELVEAGDLRAVSVGFRSLGFTPGRGDQPGVHTRCELLEVSAVCVPANSSALRIRSARGGKPADDWDLVAERLREINRRLAMESIRRDFARASDAIRALVATGR